MSGSAHARGQVHDIEIAAKRDGTMLAVRDRIWALSPEVEKRHDPPRNGVPMLIRIERMAGNAPGGPVLVAPAR